VDVEQSLPILDPFFAKALDAYSYTTSSSAAFRSSLAFQLIYVGANHRIPKKLLDGLATQLDSDFQSFEPFSLFFLGFGSFCSPFPWLLILSYNTRIAKINRRDIAGETRKG